MFGLFVYFIFIFIFIFLRVQYIHVPSLTGNLARFWNLDAPTHPEVLGILDPFATGTDTQI